jgi:hypothetical protein
VYLKVREVKKGEEGGRVFLVIEVKKGEEKGRRF